MSASRPPEVVDELLRVAFDRSPVGTLVADPDGTIVLASREVERIFGYPTHELIGKPVEILIPERSAQKHEKLRSGYVDLAQSRRMGRGRVLLGRRSDGSEVSVEVGLNPARTAQGFYVVATVVDVSQRLETERKLQESERMVAQLQKLEAVGTFAGGIAHDFNNILMGIVGYAELLRETEVRSAEAHTDVEAILASARRGAQLVQQLQVFTRKTNPPTSSLHIEAAVESSAELLRASLPPHIELSLHLEGATPNVFALESQIHQILMNLGDNAMAALSRAGGRVRVELRPCRLSDQEAEHWPEAKPGLFARLDVSDDGIGMSEATQERIFEPFFTTKAREQGTGLGLSVIHGLVRQLGGFIVVESALGKGSTFSIFLPAAPDEPDQVAVGLAPVNSRNLRALWVDDEPQLAALGRRQLRSWGIDVRAHSSSLQALEEFEANPQQFDFVISDNMMPHMSGLELSRRLTEVRPDLPVVMVTGFGSELDSEQLTENGIRRVLSKPFEVELLRQTLTELLGCKL